MPDKPIRAIDPLGIIALANVLLQHNPSNTCKNQCSCELIPTPPCLNECSCELIPVSPSCETEQGQRDLLNMMSNPIFREVIKELDLNKLKSIEDFLSIADDIRKKMDSPRLQTRSAGTKKSKNKKKI